KKELSIKIGFKERIRKMNHKKRFSAILLKSLGLLLLNVFMFLACYFFVIKGSQDPALDRRFKQFVTIVLVTVLILFILEQVFFKKKKNQVMNRLIEQFEQVNAGNFVLTKEETQSQDPLIRRLNDLFQGFINLFRSMIIGIKDESNRITTMATQLDQTSQELQSSMGSIQENMGKISDTASVEASNAEKTVQETTELSQEITGIHNDVAQIDQYINTAQK